MGGSAVCVLQIMTEADAEISLKGLGVHLCAVALSIADYQAEEIHAK